MTAFVVGDGRKGTRIIRGVADVIMVDWYPVPHLPLIGGRSCAHDHEAAGRKVWAVLQAMDWRDFPQRSQENASDDFRRGEIRFMSYDAVLNGAQESGTSPIRRRRGELCRRRRSDVAVDPGRRAAARPRFRARPGDPVPSSRPEGLRARAWTYHGRDYLVIDQPHGGPAVEGARGGARAGLASLSRVPARPARAAQEISGRLLPAALPGAGARSRLRPRRLLGADVSRALPGACNFAASIV